MAAAAAWIPAALSIWQMVTAKKGSDSSGAAARLNARRKDEAANFEADQLTINATQAFAASQRDAMEQERQGGLVQSRALAVAAAGGGSVSDPSVVNNLAKIQNEGSYRAAVALYGGESTARNMRLAAAGKRFEGAVALEGGEAAAQAYKTAGTSEILKGSASLFSKYGQGSPGYGGDSALVRDYVPGQYSMGNQQYG